MVSIAILAVLTSALMTFGFGLADRRDRLVREGERGASLARVLERLERLASTSRRPARFGDTWLDVQGRGVWPASGEAGVPAMPVECIARLEFDPDALELTWRETNPLGDEMVLVVRDVEALWIDRFEDVVTTSGGQPPVRLSLWLAPIERARPATEGDEAGIDALEFQPAPLPEDAMGMDEPPLPDRPADAVFVVMAPASVGGAGR